MQRFGPWTRRLWLVLALHPGLVRAQGPANVLVVVNDNSAVSRSVADYYARKRAIPAINMCHIRASLREDIDRATYEREIAVPIGAFLKKNGLVQSIFYIVTTSGVPLRIEGAGGLTGDAASVDSELAALYWTSREASRTRWIGHSKTRSLARAGPHSASSIPDVPGHATRRLR